MTLSKFSLHCEYPKIILEIELILWSFRYEKGYGDDEVNFKIVDISEFSIQP